MTHVHARVESLHNFMIAAGCALECTAHIITSSMFISIQAFLTHHTNLNACFHLLHNVTKTCTYNTIRVLRDYSRWKFIQTYLPYLSADFTDARRIFNGVLLGTVYMIYTLYTSILNANNIIIYIV